MVMKPLPHGLETDLEIYQAELQLSKDGNSVYFQVGFNLLSPQYPKRRVWHKFFIEGKSARSLKVSEDLYWQMLDAVGIDEDSEPVPDAPGVYKKVVVPEYIGLRVRGRIKLNKGTNGFPDTNEISLFIACN